jgi:hypothetical protein
MAYPEKFKDLHHLIRNLEYVITDSEDKDKVYAIIDRLIQDQNDVNYGDNEYPYRYLDTEVYAIIEGCGFGADQIHVKCGPSSEYRIDVLAKLGRLMPTDLYIVKWFIGKFELEK